MTQNQIIKYWKGNQIKALPQSNFQHKKANNVCSPCIWMPQKFHSKHLHRRKNMPIMNSVLISYGSGSRKKETKCHLFSWYSYPRKRVGLRNSYTQLSVRATSWVKQLYQSCFPEEAKKPSMLADHGRSTGPLTHAVKTCLKSNTFQRRVFSALYNTQKQLLEM